MPFKLTILGCGSAIPSADDNTTSQLLNVNERFFLIDCGEGTQIQLRKNRLSFQRIGHIFISHLHGDHYFGLIGLINSMHLLGRKKDLHIHGHHELKEIINLQMKASNTELKFPLFFHELPEEKEIVLFEDENIQVKNILLSHSIKCSGFLFIEKKYKRRLIRQEIEHHNIPFELLNKIRSGEDYVNEKGEYIKNEILTTKNSPPHSYAFCSDTEYDTSLSRKIKNVDLLYHEATFMNEQKDRASKTKHSTTIQAATIAKNANASNLMIGHYSRRYNDINKLKIESQTIFKRTFLSKSGMEIDFKNL